MRATTSWRSCTFLVSLAFFLTALFVSAGAPAATGSAFGGPSDPPWIASDQPDYSPGATVTLTGGNWQPGESVHIFVNDDEGRTWSFADDVIADADGVIRETFDLPDWFVATYGVTATGSDAGGSGTATTSFTDSIGGDASNSGDRSSNSMSSGTSLIVPKPSNTDPSGNDFLLAAITVKDVASTTVICAPAGWTAVRAAQRSSSGSNSATQQLFWRRAAAQTQEPSSYTFTFRSGTCSGTTATAGASGLIVRYTWVVDSVGSETGIDVADGQSGTGSSFTAPSVTTTVGRDRIVRLFGDRNATAITGVDFSTTCSACTSPPGPTAVRDEQQATAGATGSASASGSGYSSSTAASGDVWVAQTVALKAKPALVNSQVYANGSSGGALNVAPGSRVPLALNLTTTPNETWAASRWAIDGSSGCVNHGDHAAGAFSRNDTEYFDSQAPTAPGTYDVGAEGYTNDGCTTGASAASTLAGKLVVDSSTLFSDYFGSGFAQDVPFWRDDLENQVDPLDCSVTGPIDFNYFVALSRGCTISTTNTSSVPINTAGRANVHVKFTWGKNMKTGNGASLDLFWKLASSSNWALVCQTGQSSCTHTVSNIAYSADPVPATQNAVDVTLPAAASNVTGANNDSIDIRFKGNTSCSGSASGTCDVVRVDGVRVTGDPVASTSVSQVSGSGTYGGAATLSATVKAGASAVSGASVAFTLNGNSVGSAQTDTSGVATLTNVSLSGIGAGTHTNAVDASFGGNASYGGSSGSGTLTVGKAQASLAFAAGDLSQTYDGAGKSVRVTTTPSGLAGVSVSYSQGGNAVATPTNAGSYRVEASLTNGNYEASPIADTLVIDRAPQSINVTGSAPASKPYGGSFTVAAAASSGLAVAFASAGVCTNSGATFTMTSGTGTCTVKYDQAGNENYRPATQVAESVAATKAALSVTADDKSMTYADPLPALSYRITGFVNGETLATSGVTGTPTIGTAATSGSGAGSYPITVGVGTLSSSNYSFTLVNGTVTISKRAATVLYAGENYVAVPSAGSATVNVSAKVSRSGSLGDLALARVQFTVKKFSGAVQTTVYAPADTNGNAVTSASVPTSDDPYTVEVRIDPANAYWTSGVDVSSLQAIVGTGTGRTAGGGWIADAANDINGKSNFGFTVQNAKTGIKGNSLFIYRVREGGSEVQYIVKSNSWQGGGLTFNVNNDPTRATFTGKATLQRYVNGVFDATFVSGGYAFTVDDFDGDLKSPRVADGYAIVIRNSSNQVVKQLGSRSAPVTLGGGNVLIQSR
ncbi:MAG: MBG domain-containing protein [Actinomycetota bacterium]|nr:MBG domain-containing protein [Actinomycetota bacterium]